MMRKSGFFESKYKNKLDIATDTITQYWRYLVWNKLSVFHNISLVYKLCVPANWIFKRALLFWKWQELLSLYKYCIAVTNSAGAKLPLNYDNTGFIVTSNKRNKKKTVIWWGKLNHCLRWFTPSVWMKQCSKVWLTFIILAAPKNINAFCCLYCM